MPGGTVFFDVDTQVDFMLPQGALAVPGAERLIPQLDRLTTAARAHSIPIIHTADHHDRDDPEISEHPDFVETFPAHCLRGTPGAERLPETVPPAAAAVIPTDGVGVDLTEVAGASEIVMRKNYLDPLANPAARPLLEALAPDRVVVYGVALEFCDRYVVEGLLAFGAPFEIVVVEDAVAALDPVLGAALLDGWRKQGVRVVSTDEILGEIEAAGAGPAPVVSP